MSLLSERVLNMSTSATLAMAAKARELRAEGKDIIVDSKVSLISWERYVNSDEESNRTHHLGELVKAIGDHIKMLRTLGEKPDVTVGESSTKHNFNFKTQ